MAIGTDIFMHDAHPSSFPNSLSTWRGPFDQLIESRIDPKLFMQIAFFDSGSAVSHFLPVPLNPSEAPNISIGYGDIALGTLNVTDYTEYAILDPRTVKAFTEASLPNRPVSLETTHGLIRMQCEPTKTPFLFVSGITDRLGFFNTDDATRSDAQNTAAARNAGRGRYMVTSRSRQCVGSYTISNTCCSNSCDNLPRLRRQSFPTA